MNHFGKIAATLVVMGAGTSAFGADLYVKAPVVMWNDILAANNQWYLDFAATHVDYAETFAGVTLDTEKGWMPGGQTSFTAMRDWLGVQHLYYNGTFTWTHGDITHGEANPVFNGSPTHSDIKDWDFRVGKGFDLAPNVMLTPYVGAGTHWWTREFPAVPGGYKEQYNHSYAGGGLLLQWAPVSHLVLSAYGTVGGTFDPTLKVNPIPGGFPIPAQTFSLGDSVIVLAGASADYAITKEWHTNIGVDFSHFKYGQSAVGIGGFFEPASRTNNVTVKAGFGYSFY
jgi:hypothetical protein